jgi:hypothetical protein
MTTKRVALFQGEERYRNVMQALEAIADDLDLANKQRVVLKPNFVTVHKPLCAPTWTPPAPCSIFCVRAASAR